MNKVFCITSSAFLACAIFSSNFSRGEFAHAATDSTELSSLSLDDGYSISFNKTKTEYTIKVPEGRPRMPRISATAVDSNATVKIYQPFYPDDAEFGQGAVEVKNNGSKTMYKLTFEKTMDKGFVLQYGDRYDYKPKYELQKGEKFTFVSSNTNIVKIGTTNTLICNAISHDPIDISIQVNGIEKETLRINKVIPAPITFFLICGQSNSAGTYDGGLNVAEEVNRSKICKPGTVYSIEGTSGSFGTPVDLSSGRSGYGSALGKTWYELTGEKSFMAHLSVGGAPIQAWEKGNNAYGGLYDNALRCFNYYKKLFAKDNSNFEILRTGYTWCQGETAQSWEWTSGGWDSRGNYIMTADDYYNRFMKNHENFKKEMECEFGAIMLVRAVTGVVCRESLKLQLLTDLVSPRAAQYEIHSSTDNSLIIASRICDVVRMATSSDKESIGYNWMGPENVHYTQAGYNAQGEEIATNLYKTMCPSIDHSPKSLEVINWNGRDRISNNETITVDKNDGCQVAGFVLPMYNDTPDVKYEIIEGNDICTVDRFGMIKFNSSCPEGSKAKLKVSNSTGLTKTINLVKGVIEKNVVGGKSAILTWDFDNLDEKNHYNDLTISERSPKGQYTLENGILKMLGNDTDFKLADEILLTNDFSWSIEWRGYVNTASCLIGAEFDSNNFIYLAFNVDPFGNVFRMVSSNGQIIHIPYGKYKNLNLDWATWRVENDSETGRITLKYKADGSENFEVVGSEVVNTEYMFDITNLFGRYGIDDVKVCYNGEIDYMTIVCQIASDPTQKKPSRDNLDEIVNKANQINRDLYTEDSLKVLDNALKKVDDLPEDATQEAIDELTSEISKSLDNLKIYKADLTELKNYIAIVESIDFGDYEEEGVNNLLTLLNLAYTYNDSTKQADIDSLVRRLEEGMNSLKIKEKEIPSVTPSTPSTTDEPKKEDEKSGGCSSNIVAYGGILFTLISLFVLILLRKKKAY